MANCEYCKADCAHRGEHQVKACKGYIPQTKGDRYRAMSDEELADSWLKYFVLCDRCAYQEECECDEYVTIEKCKEGLLEWLKQPAEEV